jgi:hypothetical protein
MNNPAPRPTTASPSGGAAPRIAIVACAVLQDEVGHFAAGLDQIVHIEWIEQGLHNEPPKLRSHLQEAVDRIEDQVRPDAIVLGYGLCSRGIEGVTTRHAKLVIPRAHDCITLLLGSRKRYADYVAAHPGTYWYSPGWNRCHTPPGPERKQKLLDKYTAEYGQENAEYLVDLEMHWMTTYDRATYVDLTVGVTDQDLKYTQDCATWLGWNFDRQQGDPALVQALVSGQWNDDDFLVCEPGQTPTLSADDRVIIAKPAEGGRS